VSRRKFSLDPPFLLLYYCGIDMNREFFIRVVFATYRVLDILPAEEFLKVSIKDVVNEILADLMLASSSDQNLVRQRGLVSSRVLKNLDLLYDYFTRVQTRHWIDEKNFLILVEEYSKIKELLEESLEEELPQKPPEQPVEKQEVALSERQKRIVGLLRQKEKIQVWELQKVLPQVTKRTLRRDLDDLLQKSIIERQGEWNSVFYQLKR